jgi:nicotinamide-nucleotide amidase
VTAEKLVRTLIERAWTISTAESCTGGMVASAITDIAGSSTVFHQGFITYSNDAKVSMLGVSADLLAAHGAVSENVACAMAECALAKTKAHVAIAVTGIAGPGGGSGAKPVGLVHFACATRSKTVHLEKRFGNVGRENIRKASVQTALQLVLDCV